MFFFKNFFTTQTGGEYRNITDLSDAYNADAEVATASACMKNRPDAATIIIGDASRQRQIALTFDGLTDLTIVQKILDLLEKHKVKATFFVDGIQTAEDPQTVVDIRKAGHKIENYTLLGLTKMETLPVERLIKDFCRSQKIVKVTSDKDPNLLKCNETVYTELVLQAARACGFKSVVKSDIFVTVKNMNSDQAAAGFVGKIRPGSIVSVKLKPNLDPIVDEKGAIDLKPAWDKQPGLKTLPQQIDTTEKEIVVAVERLLVSLNQAKYTMVDVETFPAKSSGARTGVSIRSLSDLPATVHGYGSTMLVKSLDFLREQLANLFGGRKAYAAANDGNRANEIKLIYTAEPAIAYRFPAKQKKQVVQMFLTD